MTSAPVDKLSASAFACERVTPDQLGWKTHVSSVWITAFPIIVADVSAALAGCVLAVLMAGDMGMKEAFCHSLLPAAVAMACFLLCWPYPGSFLHPAERWRRSFWCIGAGAASCGTMCHYHSKPLLDSVMTGCQAWVFGIVGIMGFEAFLRNLLARSDWWGVRTILIGGNKTGSRLFRSLQDWHEHGVKVVAWVGDDGNPVSDTTHCSRVGGGDKSFLRRNSQPEYALIATSGVRVDELSAVVQRYSRSFRGVFLTWDMNGLSDLEGVAGSIGDRFGISFHHHLACPGSRLVKRSLDLVVILTLGIPALAFLAVLYGLVKLSSPGPAFYGHRRIGEGGRHFTVWKLRTMVENADEILADHLERHPELRNEWLLCHKLKNDPRNTSIGRILRKLSLDELPQLWNVLRGEMSLVGPRPIVDHEVTKYAGNFSYYQQVRPGITGLWQISGRNNTSYAERVEFDRFYVRNWSVWLDLYILVRTIRTVFTGHGAY